MQLRLVKYVLSLVMLIADYSVCISIIVQAGIVKSLHEIRGPLTIWCMNIKKRTKFGSSLIQLKSCAVTQKLYRAKIVLGGTIFATKIVRQRKLSRLCRFVAIILKKKIGFLTKIRMHVFCILVQLISFIQELSLNYIYTGRNERFYIHYKYY